MTTNFTMDPQQWEDDARKARNTQFHIESIAVAFAHFKKWPCITTIDNMRIALDLAKKDFKAGDAKATQ